MIDEDRLNHIIKEHFEIDPEVFEVVMYAVSTLNINEAVLNGMMSKATEVRNIPPESFYLMKRFDDGLTVNKFWIQNYAAIKMQLTLESIKLSTMRSYILFAETHDNIVTKHGLNQARAIILSKLDVMTTIAFLWKGITYAEKFDVDFRLASQLTPNHEKYFKDRGI